MQPAPKRSANGGFGSGLEKKNNDVLAKAGVEFNYESGPCVIPYEIPIRGGVCGACGDKHVFSKHKYTADFSFVSKTTGKLIIIECKGHPYAWTGETRSKHQHIKKQYPDMDLRFIFNNKHGKISNKSKTTNEAWCKRQGFQCESNLIPQRWIHE